MDILQDLLNPGFLNPPKVKSLGTMIVLCDPSLSLATADWITGDKLTRVGSIIVTLQGMRMGTLGY